MLDQLSVPADPTDLDLQFRVAASLLDEFALSHSPADVLRELVQNEYDAGGTELVIDLGQDAMVVRGNGRTIDRPGWKRLSVMLGHGQIPGASERVEQKVNGIGSKNFGLRSLFLIGDRIHIMSGGQRTILDRVNGAPPGPIPHPDSLDQPGVRLIVPYRQADDGRMRAFDERQEAEAVRTIASELAPTLIKLAHPRSGKNLRTVVLRSARLGHELRWRQSARADASVPGLIRRTARLSERGSLLAGSPAEIKEMEYQQAVSPKAGLRWPEVPGYFRVPGGRVRLGVSVRVRRGRLDLSHPGIFYYPLGASRSRTGFGFSISAPFEMNENRDQLVDTQTSDWNAWLIQQAAAFAVRLLPQRLVAAFGPSAYLALDPDAAGASTVPPLAEEIRRLLRCEACWPTQATTGRVKRPECAAAESLVVPDNSALGDLTASTLPADVLLRADIAAHPAARAIATAAGAKTFTVNSLVRLHCADPDAANLATRLDEGREASYYFTDFPGALQNLQVQQRLATALDACRAELSDAHRRDLRDSPTTMTAAKTLAMPSALWVIDQALANVVPASQVLHPGLADSRVITGLCNRFKFSAWVITTAGRLADGSASEEDRDALGRYIRDRPELSEKAWSVLRRCPVLQDQRGEWTAPQQMVSRSANGASLLEPALHFPARADEANKSLSRLRFRRAIHGSDLINLAQLTEQGKVPPPVMGQAVSRLQRLLTPPVLGKLKTIRFLESGQGTPVAPCSTYIRSAQLVALLGEGAPYATGIPASLLKRLGCQTEPHADDILHNLATLRETGQSVNNLYVLYRGLVSALRRERRAAGELRAQRIIWTGSGWEAPDDCLVGTDHGRAFMNAVTVLPEALRDDWIFLGAHRKPTEAHYRRLLIRVGERYGAERPVPSHVVQALRRAYRDLDSLPEGLSPATYCLLDNRGCLHSSSEAAAGTFLINDDPAMASAAQAAGIPLAFADTADGHLDGFLRGIGVRTLSAEASQAGTEYGPQTEPDPALRLDRAFARLQAPDFGSAVAALATAVSGSGSSRTAANLTARLARIKRITIVKGIRRRYQVAGQDVTVSTAYDPGDDQLIIDHVVSARELRRSVAGAIAMIADPERGEQVLGDAIYFLLLCKTTQEMQRELGRRKIPWQPQNLLLDADDIGEDDDEETSSIVDAISREVIRAAVAPQRSVTNAPQEPLSPSSRAPRPPLPDLEQVKPRPAEAATPSQRPRSASGSRGGGGSGAPRSGQETEEDRALGRRGEKIVLEIERARVSQLGFDPSTVIWTADAVPGADHDIKSVDDDGGELWVEVKSTTGRDGQFSWSAAEFRLAMRARLRYVMYRVYEADTTTPSYRAIRDPIGSFDAGELRLDLESLGGDIGPMVEATSSAPVA